MCLSIFDEDGMQNYDVDMIHLISWRGRGYVAFLAIFLAVAFMAAGAAFNEDIASLLFAVGWVVSGVICFILGRRWNRVADVHRFCTFRLQTWGFIYAGIGLFLMRFAWMGLTLNHHQH